jgi:hypothetical protein
MSASQPFLFEVRKKAHWTEQNLTTESYMRVWARMCKVYEIFFRRSALGAGVLGVSQNISFGVLPSLSHDLRQVNSLIALVHGYTGQRCHARTFSLSGK